ncbi:MAG: acyl-CoA thioesterase II [Pseudomonadota bacterium]
MTDPVAELLKLMDLERLELDLFRGESPDEQTSQRVFGGQVIAQALVAAYRTVEGRLCHSLHAYFIRPGDPKIPIIYEVDHARDGGSFTTRRVVAIQHGKQIFNLAASFHAEEGGWTHQADMPQTPQPDDVLSRIEYREANIEKIPERFRHEFLKPRAVEIRELEPLDPFDPKPLPDVNQIWFKLARDIGDDPALNHCLLAYASDMNLLGSGNRPHGVSFWGKELISASLDHSMWFHAPVRFENWHLYAMDSPWAGKGRSFNRGSIFTEDGVLVASVAQEGLMRRRRPAS